MKLKSMVAALVMVSSSAFAWEVNPTTCEIRSGSIVDENEIKHELVVDFARGNVVTIIEGFGIGRDSLVYKAEGHVAGDLYGDVEEITVLQEGDTTGFGVVLEKEDMFTAIDYLVSQMKAGKDIYARHPSTDYEVQFPIKGFFGAYKESLQCLKGNEYVK